MRKSFCVLAAISAMGLMMVANASAANFFTDDFTGGASANWANPEAADYTDDVAAFIGDGVRTYLRTADDHYAASDFIATADLTSIQVDANEYTNHGGGGAVMIGMGTGTPDSSNYGEPKNDHYLYMKYNGFNMNHITSIRSDWSPNDTKNYAKTPSLDPNNPGYTETMRVQMAWDASEWTMTFNVDFEMDGIYDYTYSQAHIGLTYYDKEGKPQQLSHLFIGGNDGVTVDNFSVVDPNAAVPEPGTCSLLIAGLIGLVCIGWRKRK